MYVQGEARGQQYARQRGAQLLLVQLHPDVEYWGTLLRMYNAAALKVMPALSSRTLQSVIVILGQSGPVLEDAWHSTILQLSRPHTAS